jgi:hypothetical protein
VFLGPLFYSFQFLYFESNVRGLNGGNGATFLGIFVPSLLQIAWGLSGSSEMKEVSPTTSITVMEKD